jgi:hypothetical protein
MLGGEAAPTNLAESAKQYANYLATGQISGYSMGGQTYGGGFAAYAAQGTPTYHSDSGTYSFSKQSGFEGHIGKDTNMRVHAGEDVSVKPAGQTSNYGGITINVYGNNDPEATAREVYKKFIALGA